MSHSRTRNTFPLVVLLLVAIGGIVAVLQRPATAQRQTGPFALVGGTLIDGSGATPVRNSVVLVRGERIEKVGTIGTLPVPSGYQEISTEGMTVLPGLWDPHVHMIYGGHPNGQTWFQKYTAQFERVTIPASAEQFLMAGITSVRDLAAPTDAIVAVRKRITNGELQGPTMYFSGHALSKAAAGRGGAAPAQPPAPHTWLIVDEADARAKTRQLLDAGVNIIKVTNAANWTLAELRGVVAEAHARGVKVTSHARQDDEVRRNLEAGVDEMQHIGGGTPEYPADIMAAIRNRLRTGPPLYWSPTLGLLLEGAYVATTPEYLDDPANFRGLPPDIADDIRRAIAERRAAGGRGAGTGGRGQGPAPAETAAIGKRKFAQLKEAGVELVFGSDEGTFGYTASQATWMEADIWVNQLGFDPMTVIRRMSSDPARLMGVERDSGTVSEGKYADVIAVRGDPLRHIDVLRDPSVIVKHGRRYK